MSVESIHNVLIIGHGVSQVLLDNNFDFVMKCLLNYYQKGRILTEYLVFPNNITPITSCKIK